MQHIKFWQDCLRPIRLILFCTLIAMLGTSAHATDSEQAPNIVVFGDSLVAGYQLPPGAGFPDRLQVALDEAGVTAKIIGAGVSGDTTSGGLSRLAWSVPDGTDAVILELGANDALRGLPPELSAANLDNMIKRSMHCLDFAQSMMWIQRVICVPYCFNW